MLKAQNGKLGAKARRLLIVWGVCSLILYLAFVIFWMWSGTPRGPEGLLRTFLEAAVICLLAPPVVWLIGKATIG